MMKIPSENNGARREAILEAAFQCFANYGFKRVSMDDIAVAAGLSRPALYNHFRNKTEIFRACFVALAGQVAEDAGKAALAAGNLVDGLDALVNIAFIRPHREIGQMPHGAELLGMKTDFAADLMEEWYRSVEKHACAVIGRWGGAGASQLGAETAGRLFVHAVEGIKGRLLSIEEAEADMKAMVRLFAAALRPEKHSSQT